MSRSSRPLRAYKGSEAESQGEDDDLDLSDAPSAQSFDRRPDRSDGDDGDDDDDDDDDGGNENDDSASPSMDEDYDVQEDLRSVSFGALAEAQDSLGPQSHRNTAHNRQDNQPSSRTDAEKVNLLRERLAELKKLKSKHSTPSSKQPTETPKSIKDHSRTSKHAPAEQTSRRAVSRYRPVIEIAQDPFHSRDPRFSSLSSNQPPPNEERARKNYAFLGEYRSAELANLKATLAGLKQRKAKRKSKLLTADEEAEVAELRRNINSIENRAKADAAKERQAEIVRRHKREERDKIREGKKPYFLKKSELKERAEKERFDSMKAKEREKIMDRRRKKQGQREKRAMPNLRRLP